VAAGYSHTCALRQNGQVACWGDNFYGQLGTGTPAHRATVSNLTDAAGAAAGWWDACALRQNGQVVCWGDNSSGQLGDGTTDASQTPVAVSGLLDGAAIRAGGAHNCGLRQNGQVVCWGDNDYGQLGDGTTTDAATPVAVSDLVDAVALSAGGYHSCALRQAGQVVCWGDNSSGQLGDGTATSSVTPVAVSGLTDAASVARLPLHLCTAPDRTGRLLGRGLLWPARRRQFWRVLFRAGRGLGPHRRRVGDRRRASRLRGSPDRRGRLLGLQWLGQLGDASLLNAPTPVAVSGLVDALSAGAGGYYTCALRRTDRLAAGEPTTKVSSHWYGQQLHRHSGDGIGLDQRCESGRGADHACAVRQTERSPAGATTRTVSWQRRHRVVADAGSGFGLLGCALVAGSSAPRSVRRTDAEVSRPRVMAAVTSSEVVRQSRECTESTRARAAASWGEPPPSPVRPASRLEDQNDRGYLGGCRRSSSDHPRRRSDHHLHPRGTHRHCGRALALRRRGVRDHPAKTR